MRVISNSTPLIHLARCGYLGLLKDLFGEICVPGAVHTECVVEGEGRRGCREIAKASWISVVDVTVSPLLHLLRVILDAGEAEAICLALEMSPGTLLLMDEAAGRRKSRSLGLRTMGSIGVLWRGAQKGIVPSFPKALDDLECSGFWLNRTLKQRILDDWARNSAAER